MKLVYKTTGIAVAIGDTVRLAGTPEDSYLTVAYFRPPHKAGSSGKISLTKYGHDGQLEYFVGVIGAEWIEREDRGWSNDNASIMMNREEF